MKQILIALDQLINTLLGGWADETLSARCWRCRHQFPFFVLRPLIDAVLFFDPDHCRQSYISERLRLQSPPEERVAT